MGAPSTDGRRFNSAEIARRNGAKGGRPTGDSTRLTRFKANEIARSGVAPLDIMLNNMLFWHRAAQSIGEKLAEAVTQLSDEGERTVALKMLQEFLHAREQAQRCACDAAPYVHPKLASVTLKGDIQGEVKHVLGSMTAQEAANAYATMLRKPKMENVIDPERETVSTN